MTELTLKQHQPPVHITGIGLVSPLGHSAWGTFHSLLQGRSITDRADGYPVDAAQLDPTSFVRAMGSCSIAQHNAADPCIELAEHAAREALTMAGVPESDWPGVACFMGVSKGAMIAWQRELYSLHRRSTATGKPIANSMITPTTFGPVGFLTYHLRRRLNLGLVQPVMGACASSLIALHLARLALCSDSPSAPKRVLVVTCEAALLPMFVHSYKRLGVLPPLRPGEYAGLPLDRQRRGFMLSELAAAVVVEQERSGPVAKWPSGQVTEKASGRVVEKASGRVVKWSSGRVIEKTSGQVAKWPSGQVTENKTQTTYKANAATTKAQVLGLQLLNTAIAGEGYDLMQPAPNMPALREVIHQVTASNHVDVLHPHATGTADNDEAEMSVYERELNEAQSTKVYACKGALGHGLGAAGLVSLVLACMCGRTGRIPAMPWLTQPIESKFTLQGDEQTIGGATNHAVFAAGFGGHVAGAMIRHTPNHQIT